MSLKIKKFVAAHDRARQGISDYAWLCDLGTEVTFSEPKKTRDQEELYHAIFDEAAKNCKHLNRSFSREGWKRLLVDQFVREMLEDPNCDKDIRENLQGSCEIVPSLDGRAVVSLNMSTRKFEKKTASVFINWLEPEIESRKNDKN